MRRREQWTREMIQPYIRTAKINTPIFIVRKGPPRTGQCYFDDQDRLVFITEASMLNVRLYFWRRVYTDGSLSLRLYRGERYHPFDQVKELK